MQRGLGRISGRDRGRPLPFISDSKRSEPEDGRAGVASWLQADGWPEVP